jgi:two-component system capsular synthesis sensor histidine kinase RcsC
VLFVTGEYDLDVIAALRALQSVTAVWITRNGPHRPTWRAEGVLEVSEFSHVAILAGAEMAADQKGAGIVAGAEAEGFASAQPLVENDELPSTKAVAYETSSAAGKSLQGLVILVAEDNPLNQSLIVEQLRALGCEPILAGDGRQALAVLENTEVDVVLTDIHMPVMDGYELLAALRRQYPGLPVMAFSAVTDVQQLDDWRQRGFNGHVAKPTSLRELEAALDPLCGSEPTSAFAEPNAAPGPAFDAEAGLDPTTKARYVAMLKDHLSTDLPRLSAIVERGDRQALRDWAHSAGGAFLIVGEPQFAAQCRELQNLCQKHEAWSAQMATFAMKLHEGLRSHFGLDVTSMH